jgi:hypothetical protein
MDAVAVERMLVAGFAAVEAVVVAGSIVSGLLAQSMGRYYCIAAAGSIAVVLPPVERMYFAAVGCAAGRLVVAVVAVAFVVDIAAFVVDMYCSSVHTEVAAYHTAGGCYSAVAAAVWILLEQPLAHSIDHMGSLELNITSDRVIYLETTFWGAKIEIVRRVVTSLHVALSSS